jgi:hypothetical protein
MAADCSAAHRQKQFCRTEIVTLGAVDTVPQLCFNFISSLPRMTRRLGKNNAARERLKVLIDEKAS